MATIPDQPQYPNSKDRHSYESGLAFQDFVSDLLREELGIVITNYQSQRFQFGVGENKQGIEIKLDRDILRTGNVSIEVAEKTKTSNKEYVSSGIYRSDNSWLYIQGNTSIVFIFAKSTLRLLHKSGRYRENTLPTLKSFLLPAEDARKYAAKVVEGKTEAQKLARWRLGQ